MQFFSDIGNTLTNTVQNFGSNITSIGSSVLSIVNPSNISNTLNYSSQFIQPVTSILQANPISTVTSYPNQNNLLQNITNPISTIQNIASPITSVVSSSSNLLSSVTNTASSLLSTGTSIVSSVGSTASSLLSGNTLLYIGAILLLLFLLK